MAPCSRAPSKAQDLSHGSYRAADGAVLGLVGRLGDHHAPIYERFTDLVRLHLVPTIGTIKLDRLFAPRHSDCPQKVAATYPSRIGDCNLASLAGLIETAKSTRKRAKRERILVR